MKTRVISGIIGAVIAAFAVINFYTPFFDVAAFAIYAIAVSEICKVFKEGNAKFVNYALLMLGIIVLFNSYINIDLLLATVLFVVVIVCVVVFDFENIKFISIASSVALSLYVLLGVYSIIGLKTALPYAQFGWDGAFMFVLCAGITWGGDIMAYFSGYLFGKHKLAPKLSPKKTIEGAVGGVIGSVVIALLMAFVYSMLGISANGLFSTLGKNAFVLAIIAAIGSCMGIVGDLFASAIKRQAGIKDYGAIMPGHGGVMDRFDSFLFVSPVIYLMADFIAKF